eukprot:1156191-Pelagomonas_calceolata.AAC.13
MGLAWGKGVVEAWAAGARYGSKADLRHGCWRGSCRHEFLTWHSLLIPRRAKGSWRHGLLPLVMET